MSDTFDTPAPPFAAARLLPDHAWATAVVSNAAEIEEADLTASVLDAYREIFRQLRAREGFHVVRMWNFIPRIVENFASGLNRYMAFNAGRFAALSEAFGDVTQLAERAPAASGVGTAGRDLSIHALLSPIPGSAVHNPVQIDPVNYSARFGPRPPCFSRATCVGGVLFVSGTASIFGEESVHEGHLPDQCIATVQSLRNVLTRGLAVSQANIDLFRAVRIHCPRRADLNTVHQFLREHGLRTAVVELVHVELCRPELLVEIEGVATESSDHE